MKKINLRKTATFMSEVAFASLALQQAAAHGAVNSIQQGITASQPTGASNNLFGNDGLFHTISDTLIFIVGAVSVIMLIIGGLRYVLSSVMPAPWKVPKTPSCSPSSV